jgi:hypothetical protein
MTSVLGHLTDAVFGPGYNDWKYPPPGRLFDAPVQVIIKEVCSRLKFALTYTNQFRRNTKQLRRTLKLRPGIPKLSLYGLTVIGRESILAARYSLLH